MIHKESKGIHWLEFELLSSIPGLKHAVFLRQGGVSPPPFDSLNLSEFIGDKNQAVEENKKRAQEILGIKTLQGCVQTHSKNIEIATGAKSPIENCDGLITNKEEIGLLIRHADCQAAIFYDPIRKVIGNVHAGWRGNVQNIYREAIIKMKEKYGSNPKDLIVCISPSLGPDKSEFKNYKKELPASWLSFQHKPLYFNLWEIAKSQLEEEGVKQIEIAEICTSSHDFYSYRREKITGRHGTVVALSSL